jgi:hypothetical protein
MFEPLAHLTSHAQALPPSLHNTALKPHQASSRLHSYKWGQSLCVRPSTLQAPASPSQSSWSDSSSTYRPFQSSALARRPMPDARLPLYSDTQNYHFELKQQISLCGRERTRAARHHWCDTQDISECLSVNSAIRAAGVTSSTRTTPCTFERTHITMALCSPIAIEPSYTIRMHSRRPWFG